MHVCTSIAGLVVGATDIFDGLLYPLTSVNALGLYLQPLLAIVLECVCGNLLLCFKLIELCCICLCV